MRYQDTRRVPSPGSDKVTNVLDYQPADPGSPGSAHPARQSLVSTPYLLEVLNAMPHLVAILDSNRGIVAANKQLIQHIGEENLEGLWGQSPGDLMRCQTLCEASARCGQEEACKQCGANLAILESRNGKTSATMACQITSGADGTPLDLEVTASFFQVQDQDFTVLSIVDLEDQNRRRVLERIFFHDVLNSAGGALGLASELTETDSIQEVREFSTMLEDVLQNLIDEIQSQRDMRAAERGDLEVSQESFETTGLIGDVIHSLCAHQVAEERALLPSPNSPNTLIKSDRKLLFRVLVNLAKNALEATPTGGTVTLGFTPQESRAVFWVHNPGEIPRSTQLQIFRRSFSTKGSDRGIGTYSIKLLGERYLGGKVFFESSAESGTTFSISLPCPE